MLDMVNSEIWKCIRRLLLCESHRILISNQPQIELYQRRMLHNPITYDNS